MEALPATRKELESAQSAAYQAHLAERVRKNPLVYPMYDASYPLKSFWPKHESVEEIVHFEGGDFTKPLTFAETEVGKTYIIIYNRYPLKVGAERCRDKYQVRTRKDAAKDWRRPMGVCVDHWYEAMWDWPYMGNFWGKDACVFFEKV